MKPIRILICAEDSPLLEELEQAILDAAKRAKAPLPVIRRTPSPIEASREVSDWQEGGELTIPDGLLSVRKGRTIHLIDPREILWARSEDDYSAIHAQGGIHLVRIPISRLEELLPGDRWIRVHRRYLVRVDQIRGWRSLAGGRLALRLADPHGEFPVSRGNLPKVRALLRLDSSFGQRLASDKSG